MRSLTLPHRLQNYLDEAIFILSVDYPHNFFFPLCLVLVSYSYHFYFFIFLLPFGRKQGQKNTRKIMLFLDPVMSSSIRCLLFQNSLKRSQPPLCTEHGLWTSTLVPPHSLWDMRIQDLLLSFPPKCNCIRSHGLSHGHLVRLLPPWIAHNWSCSLLHSNALILLYRILPYEVIVFYMALSYIHLQLAT